MTFYEDDFYGRSSGAPANWQQPSLRDVRSPDANGATRDTQGLLTGPIVEVSPGRFRVSVSGGVAKTNPADGAVMIFDARDINGNIVTNVPRGFSVSVEPHTPFAGSSGGVMMAGLCGDNAMFGNVGGGMDWDNADPRTRVSSTSLLATSLTSATMVNAFFNCSISPALSAPNLANMDTARTHGLDAGGIVLVEAVRTIGRQWPSAPLFYVAVLGSGVLGAATVEFSIRYSYDESPTEQLQ